MAHDVFISYSSRDKVTADAVCGALEERGVRCWIAPRDIVPGLDWSDAIIDAIVACRVFFLVLSKASNESEQVKREVQNAVSERKHIFTFLIEEVDLTKHMRYFIGTPHWMDALTPPIEPHLARVADAMRKLIDSTAVVAETAPVMSAAVAAETAPVSTAVADASVPAVSATVAAPPTSGADRPQARSGAISAASGSDPVPGGRLPQGTTAPVRHRPWGAVVGIGAGVVALAAFAAWLVASHGKPPASVVTAKVASGAISNPKAPATQVKPVDKAVQKPVAGTVVPGGNLPPGALTAVPVHRAVHTAHSESGYAATSGHPTLDHAVTAVSTKPTVAKTAPASTPATAASVQVPSEPLQKPSGLRRPLVAGLSTPRPARLRGANEGRKERARMTAGLRPGGHQPFRRLMGLRTLR